MKHSDSGAPLYRKRPGSGEVQLADGDAVYVLKRAPRAREGDDMADLATII